MAVESIVYHVEDNANDQVKQPEPSFIPTGTEDREVGLSSLVYRTFKRRWFGVSQLMLLNIMTSWNWVTFVSVPSASSTHFGVSESAINALSIAYMGGFCMCCLPVIWIVHHRGLKFTLLTGAVGLCIGGWIRYAGAVAGGGNYGVTMFGQVLIGMAGPVTLILPTHYSELWFSPKERISATAVMALANPTGAAIGQATGPIMANSAESIPDMVLYLAIIGSVAAVCSVFVPGRPPAPASPASEAPRMRPKQACLVLMSCTEFWLFFIPFSVYVGFFGVISSLLDQILSPYGVTEETAGLCGATLIGSGLIAAAIISPLVGRYQVSLMAIKIQAPLIGIGYLIFLWVPGRAIIASYMVLGIIGACSFSLLPIVLEWLVEVTHPIAPEVTSSICWMGGQLLSVIFVLIMQSLKDDGDSNPPHKMTRALIFQAVIALFVVPFPLCVASQRSNTRNQGR